MTQTTRTENVLKQQGSRLRYLLYRVFPPMDQIKVSDPFFYRHKWLMPVLWFWRLIRGRNRAKTEMKYLFKK